MHVFLNDKIVHSEQAYLHISDLSIQRGYGVFDYFQMRGNIPLYVKDHLQRLVRSCEMMRLPLPYSQEQVLEIVNDLQQKNQLEHSGMRLLLTGGYSPDAYQISKPNFVIMQNPLKPSIHDPLHPLHIISHDYVRDIPEAKTINYTMGIWLQKKVADNNADDVLFYHQGEVSEFPRCNFYIVNQENIIITPKQHVLKGITRKQILKTAKDHFIIKEAPVSMNDIFHAKEAFLSSTTKRVQPIVSLDGKTIGNGKIGPVTTKLYQILTAFEDNYVTSQHEAKSGK